MAESLFEERDPQRRYFAAMWPGGGGDELCYRTMMVNNAIIADDWPKVKEAVERGWLTAECRSFDNSHIIDFCLTRNAKKVALELRALGWPEWQRRAA